MVGRCQRQTKPFSAAKPFGLRRQIAGVTGISSIEVITPMPLGDRLALSGSPDIDSAPRAVVWRTQPARSHLMANRLNGLSTKTASRNTPRLKSLSESVIRAILVQNSSLLPPTVKYTTCTPPGDRV
jgi:hypothetical protein